MSGPVRIALGAALLAAVAWLGWTPVRAAYFEPRAELGERIATLAGTVERYRRAADDHARVEDALRAYADRTLGGDVETVDHELRSRLNRIGEDLGLEGLSVGTGRTRALDSPARTTFSRQQADLRQEIDFVEVEGWVSGRGSLDQALRLVHRVRSEPWIKRIDHARVQPKDDRFAVTVRLVTLFLPGREPATPLPPVAEPGGFERYAALVRRNPFRVPAETPTATVAAPPAPQAALAGWTLTGIASGPDGVPEAWLLHPATGRTRRLAVGETIEDATLTEANGDRAVFRIGDRTLGVTVGGRLGG